MGVAVIEQQHADGEHLNYRFDSTNEWLDKLIAERTKGRAMERILRE